MTRPRARDIGLSIGRLEAGEFNAITDVPGVLVGHSTIKRGEGPLVCGEGPVRTGVTAIVPHSENVFRNKVKAATHVINGFGKSCGLAQVDELGVIETPILLTNTLSVGAVHDALVQYMLEKNPEIGVTTGTVNCVVGECNDGYLNDIRGGHVKREHVFMALRDAKSGNVEEGAVGAGTGMSCLGHKGGIGTSSRVVTLKDRVYHLGVLVLANFGDLESLTVAGVPVGRELAQKGRSSAPAGDGSIMMILAMDAPLESRQVGRVAKRAVIGLGRTGSHASHGSGDFVLAFTTANKEPHFCEEHSLRHEVLMRDDDKALNMLFAAAAEATEEAILNALFKAETTTGRDGHTRRALPLEEVSEILRRYSRLR